jgi:hypothetical protein
LKVLKVAQNEPYHKGGRWNSFCATLETFAAKRDFNVSQPRRPHYESLPPWKLQFSCKKCRKLSCEGRSINRNRTLFWKEEIQFYSVLLRIIIFY